MKLFLMAVSQIKANDVLFSKYRIYVKDFIQAIGTSSKDEYSRVKETVESLMKKIVEIPSLNEDKVLLCQLFWPCEYHKGQGFVDVQFYSELRDYLLQLKEKFTQYDIKNILRIKSFASIRMYELLKQYEHIGKRQFSVEELKHLLKVEDKYKLYADFKRYVLNRAKKDLEKYCDIGFDFKEVKRARKVDRLVFHIFRKDSESSETLFKGLQNELKTNYLLTSKQAKEVLKKYEKNHDTLRKILDDLKERYKQGSIEKLWAYSYKTLMEAYQEKSLFDIEINHEAEKKATVQAHEKQRQQERQVHENYFQTLKEEAIKKIEEWLSEEEKLKLSETFQKTTQSKFFEAMKQREGGKQILWYNFLAKQFLEDWQKDFESYLKHINFRSFLVKNEQGKMQ